MKSYDPNIAYGVHIVEVTLQQWGYVGHIKQEVHGKYKGRDIIDFDFECECEFLDNDCNLKWHEDYDYYSAILKDPDGNTLEVEGSYYDFNQMIVKVEIVDFIKRGEPC